jgi:UDP-N-acetylmuramate--alanine ligase
MNVYFSGISGTGIGPLAELAQDAGYVVFGSDLKPGAISEALEERKVNVSYGKQSGDFLLKTIEENGVDWFVYTSALPDDHPELQLARERGIKCTKRDEFLANLVEQKGLKMVAIAGTHGKTTTTAMIIWAMKQLGLPASYLVGTTLSWSDSGKFDPESKYFIYEADEYDRNFLAYHPYIAAITCIDYDHPDIYPTVDDYRDAFDEFMSQSDIVVKNTAVNSGIILVGGLRRQDASIALEVIEKIAPELDFQKIIDVLNDFPGAGRRFERITHGVFTDYAHHPNEIASTVKMANELKRRDNYAGLAVIYQPHQNTRQYEVREGYKNAFVGADKIFWLPTYLTRENPDLSILSPEELIEETVTKDRTEIADLDESLAEKIHQLHNQNWLIVLMTAGPADDWLRKQFASD